MSTICLFHVVTVVELSKYVFCDVIIVNHIVHYWLTKNNVLEYCFSGESSELGETTGCETLRCRTCSW